MRWFWGFSDILLETSPSLFLFFSLMEKPQFPNPKQSKAPVSRTFPENSCSCVPPFRANRYTMLGRFKNPPNPPPFLSQFKTLPDLLSSFPHGTSQFTFLGLNRRGNRSRLISPEPPFIILIDLAFIVFGHRLVMGFSLSPSATSFSSPRPVPRLGIFQMRGC